MEVYQACAGGPVFVARGGSMVQVREFRIQLASKPWPQIVGGAGVVLGFVVPVIVLGNAGNAAAWGKAIALTQCFCFFFVVSNAIFMGLLIAPVWGVRQVRTNSCKERLALCKRVYLSKGWDDIDDCEGGPAVVLGATADSTVAAYDTEQAIGSSSEVQIQIRSLNIGQGASIQIKSLNILNNC